MDTESFFWSRFTDTYIELSKARARSEGTGDAAARGSAVAALASYPALSCTGGPFAVTGEWGVALMRLQPDLPATRRGQLRKDLIDYCAYDTLALVRLAETLRGERPPRPVDEQQQ